MSRRRKRSPEQRAARRPFIVLVLGLVIVGAGLAYFLGDPVNRAVAAVIESAGSRATGTDVEVEAVRVKLRDAGGRIGEITVGNPDGFSDEPAILLGDATFALDASTLKPENLRGDAPIVIREVRFGAADVRVEIGSDGRSNLDVLRDHVSSPARSTLPGGAVTVVIEKLTVGGGRLIADTRAVGGPEIVRDLPGFELSGLGLPAGSSPAEIGEEFLTAFLRDAAEQAARGEIRSVLQDKLKGILGR